MKKPILAHISAAIAEGCWEGYLKGATPRDLLEAVKPVSDLPQRNGKPLSKQWPDIQPVVEHLQHHAEVSHTPVRASWTRYLAPLLDKGVIVCVVPYYSAVATTDGEQVQIWRPEGFLGDRWVEAYQQPVHQEFIGDMKATLQLAVALAHVVMGDGPPAGSPWVDGTAVQEEHGIPRSTWKWWINQRRFPAIRTGGKAKWWVHLPLAKAWLKLKKEQGSG